MSLVEKEVWVDEEPIHLIRMKNQQKIKSGTEWYRCGKCGAMDKNVECLHCLKVASLKLQQLVISMVKDCSPTNLLNLNTCTMCRTSYSVPEAELGLRQLLRWSSL